MVCCGSVWQCKGVFVAEDGEEGEGKVLIKPVIRASNGKRL